jgi:predicted phage baseplate assembly protein
VTTEHVCPGDEGCACCTVPKLTPVANRSGLRSLSRRVGTFATFRARILRSIPDVASAVALDAAVESRPIGMVPPESPLARWTARTPDDVGVALVEAAALELDVLTFYQERIANEMYLRTALEDDSIDAMLDLIGYEISPAVTASTTLVFEVEPERTVTVPAWSRVQSVPRDGEQPQTFETTVALTAVGAWNAMRPKPGTTKLAMNAATKRVRFEQPVHLRAGDTVLVGVPDNAVQRRVTAVDADKDDTTVSLDGTITEHPKMRIWPVIDSTQAYGADLPTSAVHTYKDATGSWVSKQEHRLGATKGGGKTLFLDRIVEPNGLVRHVATTADGGTWRVRSVAGSAPTSRGTGPLERTVTAVTLKKKLTNVAAGAPVHRLGAALRPRTSIPATILKAGTSTLTVTADLTMMKPGREVLVRDRRGAHVATVKHIGAAGTLELQPALPRSFDVATTVVHGNVVRARHGESVDAEVIGDGDPTAERQEFALRRGPVAWYRDGASPQGVTPDVEVRVDDVRWPWVSKRVVEPSNRSRFVLDETGDKSLVQIGTAAGGAAARRGTRNVVADYRVGGGTDGNVPSDSLKTALDRPPALRSVTNPIGAEGGSDRETAAHARAAAPAALRATGRIVSLRDFEHAALDQTGVAKAVATWTWSGRHRVVHLTVAGDDGAALSSDALTELHRFLDRQRDDRRPLRIDNYVRVPIRLRLEVTADDRVLPDVVVADVLDAIDDVLGFDEIDFGAPVDASVISRRLHEIDAVLGVRWLELSRSRTGQLAPRARPVPSSSVRLLRQRPVPVLAESMPRVALRGATAAGSHSVQPAELADVNPSRRDIVVTSVPRPEQRS